MSLRFSIPLPRFDELLGGAASWEALFVFDCLIFTLTLMRTYRVIPVAMRSYTKMTAVEGLMELIFRDGKFYFGSIARHQRVDPYT